MTGRRKSSGDQIEAVVSALPEPQPEDVVLPQSEVIAAQVDRLRKVVLDHLSHDVGLFNRLLQVRGALFELLPEQHYTMAKEVAVLTQLATRGLEERQVSSPQRRAEFQRRIDELDAVGYAAATNELTASIPVKPSLDEGLLKTLKRKKLRGAETNRRKSETNELEFKEKYRAFIGTSEQFGSASTLESRLQALEKFSIENNGYGTADYVRKNFPELDALNIDEFGRGSDRPLPNKAPEIYSGLRGPETPPEFVKRVYAPWLGQGLDRAHIKHLDPKLYTAIDNWSRKPGNEWPADVDLPTRGQQTRRTIEQLQAESPDGRIGKVLGDFTAREAQRIRSAIQRDHKKR